MTAVRPSPCHSEERSDEESAPSSHSLLRSAHLGFAASMRANFLSRRHPLICFSRVIAPQTSEVVAKYTRRSIWYFEVKPGRRELLCSCILRRRSFVTPV